jgi:hypothetical protein
MHDILTGSQPDGKAFPPGNDMTCKNWTSSTVGTAMLGHSDRAGTTDDPRIRKPPRLFGLPFLLKAY